MKCRLLEFLIAARRAGKLIAGYGAPAKGNTLLNYCGIGPELLRLHRRSQPAQAGTLPARRAASRSSPPSGSSRRGPTIVLILPWNLKDEITPPDGRGPRLGRPVRRARSRP